MKLHPHQVIVYANLYWYTVIGFYRHSKKNNIESCKTKNCKCSKITWKENYMIFLLSVSVWVIKLKVWKGDTMNFFGKTYLTFWVYAKYIMWLEKKKLAPI